MPQFKKKTCSHYEDGALSAFELLPAVHSQLSQFVHNDETYSAQEQNCHLIREEINSQGKEIQKNVGRCKKTASNRKMRVIHFKLLKFSLKKTSFIMQVFLSKSILLFFFYIGELNQKQAGVKR